MDTSNVQSTMRLAGALHKFWKDAPGCTASWGKRLLIISASAAIGAVGASLRRLALPSIASRATGACGSMSSPSQSTRVAALRSCLVRGCGCDAQMAQRTLSQFQ
ncbi:hypothetical protein LMG28614_05257 [Paraburkholderia ultramafica]|uniref:Uncharacterized protein n=1 Tax=Paraburkholderia ultramafica TaxID=1544867 RepID=A0A6S7DBC0_9BURK|nr:hypothetical protein LMG28614_05257 [Paraburkholderia ultramafica]